MSIQIAQIGDYVDEYKFYPFFIIPRIYSNSQEYSDIPKIVIRVNEYIIGNVDISTNEIISQFYEIWLPHDSDRVDFDFQSEVAGLYISLGGRRPTTKNADFSLLPPGKDSILSLDKYSILEKAKITQITLPNSDSLEGLNLVIGIWTDKTDSIDTELFSLNVRLPNNNSFQDIIEVNTDQKILCNPIYYIDEKFNCLFMITYDEEDVKLNIPLYVHASSVNQSALTYIYANFIEKNYYDEYNTEALKTYFPTKENAEYSTEKDNKDYIYTNLNSSNKYLFVNVISDKDDEIFILTSKRILPSRFFDYYLIYPHPSSEYLISATLEPLRLQFFTYSSIFINIVSLGGEAIIKWSDARNNFYYLRGRGNRLALSSSVRGSYGELIIESKVSSNNTITSSEGLVFYISHYIQNEEYNFNKIEGNSEKIVYKKRDLPIFLYNKIGYCYNDINIAITFKDFDKNKNGEYKSSPFFIKCAFAKEDTIYELKGNPESFLDNYLIGKYDPVLKTAHIFVSKEIFKSYNIKPKEIPTVLISIDKSQTYIEQELEIFSIITEINQNNNNVVPPENIYHYGKLGDEYSSFYKLRNDKDKKYMIIEISFNSDSLNFAISNEISRTNKTNLIAQYKKGKGKILLTINEGYNEEFIYLNIFKKSSSSDNLELNNYVFKYSNVNNEEEFLDYKILDNNDILNAEEKTEFGTDKTFIECSFNKIDIEKNKANITYFLRAFDSQIYIEKESYESIAFMESDYLYTVYEINPSDNNGIITLRANISSTDILYLQVIALVEEGDDYEYISYKGYEYHKPIPQPEEEEKEEEKENKKEEKENKEEEKENKEEEKGNQEEEKENKEEEKGNQEEERK